jgi:two-component system, sporulation sensor kinase E
VRAEAKPAVVMADAEQIKQVFINLLNNAMEEMPAGGQIRLDFSQSQHEAAKMVVTRVQDTGQGMPPDARARIFEPFFSTKDSGTGLGLCIAARIIEQHGGRLVLETSTDQGTTFAVWLPLAPL